MPMARAAAWYQLLDLNGLARRAGLRFLPAGLRVGGRRFFMFLLNVYSLVQRPVDFAPFTKSEPTPYHNAGPGEDANPDLIVAGGYKRRSESMP